MFSVEQETLDLIFEGQKSELFFIQSLLVPPNCFRRMNKSGRRLSPSDRTNQFKEILQVSLNLKWLQGYRAEMSRMSQDEGKNIFLKKKIKFRNITRLRVPDIRDCGEKSSEYDSRVDFR